MTQVDNFKQAFQEEAREIIVELESSLLELNKNPDDSSLVGRAFRALHTIKGSGAMFGFDELAAFSHNLENAFDEVRNGRLRVSSELINLSLTALDQIKTMLEQGPVDEVISQEILAQLRRLTDQNTERSSTVPPRDAKNDAMIRSKVVTGTTREWQVHFAPGSDLLRTGSNPLLLLGELRQLGNVQITASTSSLPPIEQLDPERCYVAWDIALTSKATREMIRDVFIFVEDSCELSIQPAIQTTAPITTTTDEKVSQEAILSEKEKRASTEHPGAGISGSASNVRVPAAKLDQFVNLVGELVTVQARLGEIAARNQDQDVADVSEEIERLTAALRESSMSIRMLPIRATFERFRRLVHDLARDLHKEVELSIEGADTELDKTVIDQLSDPLMHLIRNSMDHGIESPEIRVAAGKSRSATICLSARHSGASVLINVSDDGRGIDALAVRNRAVEKGLVAPDAQLTETEIFELILAPGFSTSREVTDVSGRGVGMDVVRRSVEALRGTIEISSKPLIGASVALRLPLTLAIIDGLLVRVGLAHFVLPLAITLECIELTRQDIQKANGKHVAYVRGEIIPYIRLREYFNIQTERPEREQIMVVETEAGRYGFVVDQVVGNYQTVIKNLGRFYRQVHVASGATILGNGTVALILDPNRLVQEAIRAVSVSARASSRSMRSPQADGAQITDRYPAVVKGMNAFGDKNSVVQSQRN